MWSDRKQEDFSKAEPSPTGGRAELTPRDVSRSVVQVGTVAVVGRGMVIRGQVRSGEHIHVDGEVEGILQLPGFDLMVSKDARVRAHVTAREVEVAGLIDGNVDATKKITVRRGGRLLGDLRTPGIVIEDGAYFKGKIEIVNSDVRDGRDEVSAKDASRKVAAV